MVFGAGADISGSDVEVDEEAGEEEIDDHEGDDPITEEEVDDDDDDGVEVEDPDGEEDDPDDADGAAEKGINPPGFKELILTRRDLLCARCSSLSLRLLSP